jgi:multiple sugar transport system permease protein
LLPAIIVLAAVIVVPLLLSLWSSFTPFRLTKPDTLYIFIGLRNYARIHARTRFLDGVRAHGSAPHHRAQSGNAARPRPCHAGRKGHAGQRTLRTIMMFPMMFSPILVGFQFKFMFNDNVGLVNNALQSLGLTDQAIPWLIDGNLALSLDPCRRSLVVDLGVRHPHSGRADGHAEGADRGGARSMAARHGRRSAMSRWPFIMPFAYIAMTIRSLDVARAYDIVKIMTDGGPARARNCSGR